MMRKNDTHPATRRDLLKWSVATATAAGIGGSAAAAPAGNPGGTEDRTLLDRLWIWTHAEGSYKHKITFWTWEAKDLARLESSFDRLEKFAPKQGKLLGCYLWDFGTGKPMPLDLMKKQCELGRQWLDQGRIEGMIFLASNVCDLELETVEWTRKWIQTTA